MLFKGKRRRKSARKAYGRIRKGESFGRGEYKGVKF